MANEPTDWELVEQIAEGDDRAFDALMEKYSRPVLNFVWRMIGDAGEAEDVAQEAMLRAWRQAPRWAPGQAKFDTWLHRVALNLCYDRLRRRREIPTDTPPERADEGPGPDRGLLAAETGLRVDAALRTLPDRQREAIVLCHYQDMSNIEAASVMEISVEALESLLSRGRRALRQSLADLSPRSGGRSEGDGR